MDLHVWLERFMTSLTGTFGDRVWFAGLQGSYGRGEAAADSDIDMVVILDTLSEKDIAAYGAMLDTLEHRELVCGFLSGREELLAWEPSDLFQFCRDTTPIRGSLDAVLEKVDRSAVDRAVRIGACNVYHGCIHNMVHEKDPETLRGLYKAATFAIRAAVFQRSGRFCRGLAELSASAGPEERAVVTAYLQMKRDGVRDFNRDAGLLFRWAQRMIAQGVPSD